VPGRDVTCALVPAQSPAESHPMSRFVAPLSFTLAAAWVLVLFILVQSTP
jgi:hypothetical protein